MEQTLSTQELDRVRQALAAGIDPERIKSLVINRRSEVTADPITETPVVMEETVTETPDAIEVEETTTTEVPETNIQKWGLIDTISKGVSTVSDFIENPVSDLVSWFWEWVIKDAKSKVTQATWSEIPFTEESKIAENFVPSAEKAFWEVVEVVWSPIDSVVNLWKTLKAIFVKGAENDPILWKFIESSEWDKIIQEAISEGIWKVKWKVEEKWVIKTINEEVQEDPALVVTMLTSVFKKLWRAWKVSDSDIKKVEELQKKAEWQVAEFLAPSKWNTTRAAKKITPEILERGITGTREEVLWLAKDQRGVYWKMIWDIEELGLKGDINMAKIDEAIDKFAIKANLVDMKWNPIAWQEVKVKALDDVMKTLRTASEGEDFVDANKLTTIRKAFDEVYKWTDESLDKFQNGLRKEVADELRRQFADSNPTLKDINKEFSFYANLDNVLTETIDRRFGKGEWGWIETKRTWLLWTLWSWTWIAVGSAVWGIPWWVVWGMIWRAAALKLDEVMSSPKWKSVSAQKKKELAEAIINQDTKTVEKIIDSIIVAQALNIDTIGDKQTKKEAESSRQDILNRLQRR